MKTLHCAVRGSLAPNAMCGDVTTGGLLCGSKSACVHQVAVITTTIYYWPDGTWCHSSEYSEATYSFKGNDFGKMEVPDDWCDDSISRKVDEVLS